MDFVVKVLESRALVAQRVIRLLWKTTEPVFDTKLMRDNKQLGRKYEKEAKE